MKSVPPTPYQASGVRNYVAVGLAGSLVLATLVGCSEKPAPQPLVNTSPPVVQATPGSSAPNANANTNATASPVVTSVPPPASPPTAPPPPPPPRKFPVKPPAHSNSAPAEDLTSALLPPSAPPEPPIALDAPEVQESQKALKAAGAALLAWKEGDAPEAKETASKNARQAMLKLAKLRARVPVEKISEWEAQLQAARKDFQAYMLTQNQARIQGVQDKLKATQEKAKEMRGKGPASAPEKPGQ